MMLTTKGRYAVMAMVYLAMNKNRNTPTTIADIAEKQSIPLNYLEQIFVRLRKNDIVQSVKGPGGGYTLAKDLSEISIAEIIHAVEEPIKIVRCTNDGLAGCMPNGAKCATHDLWDELGIKIEAYLTSVTLEDFKNGKFSNA
ncbi:MAG: Rrf2 family transcriptional regulator [Alphaproteobacteria bacterium]|nr:Rrf2 family transcriptional regulator [Alphaproteobacteria bacterium]OJV15819.1 MAG: Rrf2 family transcriptional regulator [Alphaproteobacteria bacterium 33-17]